MAKPISRGEIFKSHHTFVCGMTQNGKTHFVRKKLQETKQPVLFFNPQREQMKGFVLARKSNTLSQIVRALKNRLKINYVTSLSDEETAMELYCITERLFEAGFNKHNPVIFAIDETHINSDYKLGKQALIKIANRGLTFGINGVFISQRPANVPYTIVTQCDRHYIFKTGFEKEYFTRKGIDYNKVAKLIEEGGRFSYVEFDGININGPFKE